MKREVLYINDNKLSKGYFDDNKFEEDYDVVQNKKHYLVLVYSEDGKRLPFKYENLIPVKETVNHPEHYNKSKYETIEEMRILFGDDAVKIFCKLNAYKYKARAMYKHDDNGKEDLAKADWYLEYAHKMEKKQ